MHVLNVDGIKKHFRSDMSLAKREVLRGVTFHAREGEVLGFLGPNGAGKTTTIKVILGLIKAHAGSVTIFDRPPGDPRAMARIGYLPEMPYFYPHLSLAEFLGFCGRMSGVGRTDLSGRIDKIVEMVDLTPHRAKRLKTFSKGMLQRAGLAQAILHDPDLLILDEPFSGLDPIGRKMVRDILVDLKKRGKTIFFSSHILSDMEALCDRVCIIRDGIIAKSVVLDDLLRMGEGTIEVTARGWQTEMLQGMQEYLESVRTTGGDAFLVVREQRFVRPVIERLFGGGAEVLAVVNRHRTLENLFLREVARPEARTSKEKKEEKLVFTGF
ncbi:MAG: ABC transporter ATP-binding protein [Candidatus Krumholzibacteria bacterium]|nr:ABC transporter ATP-binding protein [Candidatus Krumholzibacteria bacterium]